MTMPGWITRGLASWRVRFGGLWRPFNKWRRERWPVRVVIIVLLGTYFLVPRAVGLDVKGLVGMAIEGIFNGCEGALVTAGARFYKAREADRLRRALRAYLDADRDGLIRADEEERAKALGIDPVDLGGLAFKADLNLLVDAARRAGLVPASYTARAVRRAAISVGRSQADEIFVPARRDVSRMLAEAGPSPRNWSLSSWWPTALALFGVGMQVLGVADSITAVAWLFFCYFAARLAVILGGERARHVAPWVPVAVIAALRPFALDFGNLDRYGWTDWLWLALSAAGWAVFSFCAAYAGSRSVSAKPDRAASAPVALAGLGGVLFAWGLISTFFWVFLHGLGRYHGFIFVFSWVLPYRFADCDGFIDEWVLFWHSGYFMTWGIPLPIKVLGVIGGASVIAYAVVRMRRASRAAGVPDGHGAKK